MFIEVKNNVLKSWANYRFSDKAVEVTENKIFDNGYCLKNNQIIQSEPPKTYRENRFSEYPSIQDQLDMIYWDKINGTNLWQEKINLKIMLGCGEE